MKILVTGGTGFVGSCLTTRLLARGDEVYITSSTGQKAVNPSLQMIQADTSKPGEWQKIVPQVDGIINLAGRSVFHLWSEPYKKQIQTSRVATTKNLVDALPDNTDIFFLSGSAVGYYGNGGERVFTEGSEDGSDFLAKVCKVWEETAFEASQKGARVITMRFGVVLGKSGGAMATMQLPFSLGLGGPIGSGKQWFPWIHIDDLISAIVFIMDSTDLDGPFNFTAPVAIRQKDFAGKLGRQLKRPAILPVPAFLMRKILGEFGESLLQGQKVVPKKLQERGFLFSYPDIDDCLREILNG